MAKKFVRGITDVKTINNQDFDTNNVNDLLSDGQYNYIHRKKGKNEEYHNLTDNIKTISSDNTELLTVTNNNKTTNTATLHPKHDKQKEQVIESTRNTVTIHHGENGTDEKTTVDTNPKKVLEHDNLLTDYGISKNTTENTTKLGLEYTRVPDGFDLNTLVNGNIAASNLTNAASNNEAYFVQSFGDSSGDNIIQTAFKRVNSLSESANIYRRYKINNRWGDWRELLRNKDNLNDLLNMKQNTITTNTSIGVSGTALQQLYSQKQSYSHTNGILKTHVKSVSSNTSVNTPEEEFNFILKINQAQQSATFTLSEHDKGKFGSIITAYGVNGSVRINDCLFTLSDATLTVTTDANTGNNYIITFSDII